MSIHDQLMLLDRDASVDHNDPRTKKYRSYLLAEIQAANNEEGNLVMSRSLSESDLSELAVGNSPVEDLIRSFSPQHNLEEEEEFKRRRSQGYLEDAKPALPPKSSRARQQQQQHAGRTIRGGRRKCFGILCAYVGTVRVHIR